MSFTEIDKIYDPEKIEERIYQFWLDANVFHGKPNPDKKPYSIVIPPPNVTDRLHMGHAYNNTLQDILIRFKKMLGFETMWMPGTDHAGIATQTVVERDLKQNENKTRHDFGREKFVERVWEWKEKHGAIIIDQLKKLGCACDWERERFTMDEGLSEAVQDVFIKLYERGLIYKGQRIVNWDPASATALADDEVEHKEVQGKLYHIKYYFTDSDEFLVVATTRPETLLGDSGIAIAPDDAEKQHLIGKKVIIPFVNREVAIFADEHVDKEFGSGFVKATPAHDPNDFEMGERHNLDQLVVMDKDGCILKYCVLVNGSEHTEELPIPDFLAGVERFEARKRIVAELRKQGDIVKIEEHVHSIGHSYRSKVPIEPYLSEQWFVKMKPLAEKALEAVHSGKVKLYPEGRYDKTYEHWMNNIRDWCISRQLWWGHRIPAWYNAAGEIKVSATDPSTADEKWTQDPDVLDTWFSSQLWPFSTLGWPEETESLKYFYPTNTLVTGADIIFFWVARMIMAGLEFREEIPFDNVYFNGIVRDENGHKMSKSLGNGIDPLEMIEKYSADAVRYTLLSLSSEGQDIFLGKKDFEIGRNFTNKLWNSFRFLGMHLNEEIIANSNLDDVVSYKKAGKLDLADEWILSRYTTTIRRVTKGFEEFKFHDAVNALHAFFWREYCDWYLELSKPRLYGQDEELRRASITVALFTLKGILKLLHPLIPFITEEIWQHIGLSEKDCIMQVEWPTIDAQFENKNIEADADFLQSLINAVRNIRGEMNVPPKNPASLLISGADDHVAELVKTYLPYFNQLANVDNIQANHELKRPELSAMAVVNKMEVFVPLSGLIDIDKEKQRLEKERTRLDKQLIGLSRKLENNDFLDRAPEQVIEREKQKLQDWRLTLDKITENLEQLSN
ncbi:MAG: valine--tRNA ligase [Calditrichaeota bacterium]|nr:MAG: valine--tRNA ligase [Calditrichota bacterium]